MTNQQSDMMVHGEVTLPTILDYFFDFYEGVSYQKFSYTEKLWGGGGELSQCSMPLRLGSTIINVADNYNHAHASLISSFSLPLADV